MSLATFESEFGKRSVVNASPGDVTLKVAGNPLRAIVVGSLSAVVLGSAVDQNIVAGRRNDGKVGSNGIGNDREVRDVEPVRKHDRADIDVVLHLCRAVDLDRANDTASVLSRIMGVVPRRAEEFSLELVGERVHGCNRALANRGYTIVPLSVSLKQTMPVHCSTFEGMFDVVVDSDLDPIAPVGLNQRTRELAVDQNDIAKYAIGGDLVAGDVEVVVAGVTGVGNIVANSCIGVLGGLVAPRCFIVLGAVVMIQPSGESRLAECSPSGVTDLVGVGKGCIAALTIRCPWLCCRLRERLVWLSSFGGLRRLLEGSFGGGFFPRLLRRLFRTSFDPGDCSRASSLGCWAGSDSHVDCCVDCVGCRFIDD